MLPRFVIVPALPAEKENISSDGRHYETCMCVGFDIYDNQLKKRLKPKFKKKKKRRQPVATRTSTLVKSIGAL